MSANVWNPGADVLSINANTTIIKQLFTATAGQQVFNLTLFEYATNTGSLLVFRNGQLLDVGVSETSTSSFTLTSSELAEGEEIIALGFVGITAELPAPYSATNISYRRVGTSTLDQLLQDYLQQSSVMLSSYVDVLNSAVDAAPALQRAINDIAVLGRGVLVINPGYEIYLNSQVNVCDNLVIVGYGAKIKLGTGFAGINKPLFKNFSGTDFNSPGTRLASKNIAFLGLTIDGQDAGIAGSLIPNANMHGAIIGMGGWTNNSGVDGLIVRDCDFSNFAGAGVMAWKSTNLDVCHNKFKNFLANATLSVGSCIDFHEVSNVTIAHNEIDHDSLGLSWHGLVVLDWDAGCTDVSIVSNIITNMNNGDGISCESNGVPNLDASIISANIIHNCAGDGIHIQKCVDVTVTNNNIKTNVASAGIGINFTDTPNAVIVGNTIEGAYISGIFSNGGTTRALIAHNRIMGMVYGNANYQGEAIFVYAASTVIHSVLITNNYIKDVDGCGIYSALENSIVTDNFVYNFGRSASAVRDMGVNSLGKVYDNIVIGVSANCSYGINIEDGADVRNNKVIGTFTDGKYRVGWRNGIYSGTFINYDTLTYDDASKTMRIRGNAAPVASRWVVGDIVDNNAPASGGYIGWVCTVAGVPGTWNTFGLIS